MEIKFGCSSCIYEEFCEHVLIHKEEVKEARKFFSQCSNLVPVELKCKYFLAKYFAR